jgi:hypothetical protein
MRQAPQPDAFSGLAKQTVVDRSITTRSERALTTSGLVDAGASTRERSTHAPWCVALSLRARCPCSHSPSYDRSEVGSDNTLQLLREDDGALVLGGLAIARAFIIADPSAKLGGCDSLAGLGATTASSSRTWAR